jgi:AraC-like DNA-binding protein
LHFPPRAIYRRGVPRRTWEALVPAATARGILAGLDRLGHDANGVARRAGLSPRELEELDAMVPAEVMRRLWLEVFRLGPDQAWPTRLALAVPFGAFGLLDYAAASASRVGELLEALVRSFEHVATDASLEIDRRQHGVISISVVNARPFDGSVITDEFTVAVVVGRLRQLARGPVDVRAVSLTRKDLVPAHERLLGAQVLPAAVRAAVHLAAAAEEVPITRADPALSALAAKLTARFKPPARSEVSAQARARIQAVSPGVASASAVAKALGMSERTMLRRLAEEGTTFRSLLGGARSTEAERLLGTTALPLAQIADALGYADQTTFTRAFTRAHGVSPAAFRVRAREAEPGASPRARRRRR